jgi:hypothetical protein
MTATLRGNKLTLLFTALLLMCPVAVPEEGPPPGSQDASDLLSKLLSRNTPDVQFSKAEQQFEALPPKIALPLLFPEIAKGIPGGFSYAAYNCSEPFHDRKVSGWGEFCIVNWLWCKQLACPLSHPESSKILLELWAHPISYYGQMALLQGLCGDPHAELRIAELFQDTSTDLRLRTEAAVCLMRQNAPKYHSDVFAFADKAPTRFVQPGVFSYDLNLRRRLFNQFVSPGRGDLEVDPAVVRMGFGLLLDEAERKRKANQSGANVSYYGQFIYAESLNTYLGTRFEPNQKQPIYTGSEGNERFWRDTVVNALDWGRSTTRGALRSDALNSFSTERNHGSTPGYRWLLLTGDFATLRFLFASSTDFECYGDLSTESGATIILPYGLSLSSSLSYAAWSRNSTDR